MKIVHNRLLGGWFIVRGAHDTPIGGRFDSKAQAQAYLRRDAVEDYPTATRREAAAAAAEVARRRREEAA
jgi:hypothetical protein